MKGPAAAAEYRMSVTGVHRTEARSSSVQDRLTHPIRRPREKPDSARVENRKTIDSVQVCGRRPTGRSRANTLLSASLLPHVFYDLLGVVSLLLLLSLVPVLVLVLLVFVLLPVLVLDVLLVDWVLKSNDVPLVEFT